jgi:hypothetical protein
MSPFLTFGQLHPGGTASAFCYDQDCMRLLCTHEWQIEAASGVALTVLGEMPALCHANAMTDTALAFFELSQLKIAPSVMPYRSEAEALGIARKLAKADYRFAYPFPLAEPLRRACSLLVEQDLYQWLNNKTNIAWLCEPQWLPPRQIFPIADVAVLRARPPDRPVYVKGAMNAPSGGGVDVRYSPSGESWGSVLDWVESMADWFDACIVEDAIPFSQSWCLNYAIMNDEIRYLGAAEQLFSSPGVQRGSLVDDANQPPDKAVQVGFHISTQAQRRGYRGFAGYDMCIGEHGQIYFFDLNFRLNSSTSLLLLHRGLDLGQGSHISVSCNHVTGSPLDAALQKLADVASDGAFIPVRLYDGSRHSTQRAPSVVTGILTARSREAVTDLEKDFSGRFPDPTI